MAAGMHYALETLPTLLWGTLTLRPYVFAFLLAFLIAGARDLGTGRVWLFLVWGFLVALTAEYASTRTGIPFGLYHYTGETQGLELFIADVPFFDSMSFPFLAYAALSLARWTLPTRGPATVAGLAGVLMMLLDVVIDPLAVRGDRWFLGRIFYYPSGGVYFGVPLSNFLGWLIVGCVITGGYLAMTEGRGGRRPMRPSRPGPGVGLYYGVLAFNLVMTWWIGEPRLVLTGILLHFVAFLLVFGVRARGAAPFRRGEVRRVSRPRPDGSFG